jgi:hypothetical protein
MRQKLIVITIALFSFALLSSCSVNQALQLNQNITLTQVNLGSANFKVLERVHGSAEHAYVCMIGIENKTDLYARAKADLMKNSNLTGTSKALINIIAEEHLGGLPPIYFKRTVTYSADVIEFIKP